MTCRSSTAGRPPRPSITPTSRDKADISGVFVQMKLTVVAPDRLQEIVPEISQYSNTQNKVTLVDFSSNHPFHVAVEKVTRSLWAPAADGSGQETRWFYERARGQYADALARERTPARQRAFKTLHPLRQKFTKSDAAKFEHSWDQLPAHRQPRRGEELPGIHDQARREDTGRRRRLLPAADRQGHPVPRHGEDRLRAASSAVTAPTSSPTPSPCSPTTPGSASTSTASGGSRASPRPSPLPSTT